MKISRTRFVIIFLISAFAFQFITNSLLGPELKLFPKNTTPFPGAESSIAWKSIIAAIIFPIKFILLKPLAGLFELPDPPPPLVLLPFIAYWTVIALIVHFILSKIRKRKNQHQ